MSPPTPLYFTDDRTESWRGLLFAGGHTAELGSEGRGFLRLCPSAACSSSLLAAVTQAGNHRHPLGVYFKISKLLFAYKHQICRRCNAQLRLAAHRRADCTRPGRTPAGSHVPAVTTALSLAAAGASESPLLKF